MNRHGRGFSADPLIFGLVLAASVAMLALALWDLPALRDLLLGVQAAIAEYFAWLFSLTVTVMLFFVIYIACSRFGDVRLGGPEARPRYSRLSWLSMLFSAGMGIGLVFFGVAEPVLHFLEPPPGTPDDAAAAREALRITLFHWGLHAWAIYAVLGMALAYCHYCRQQPLALRSTLQPLLGSYTHRVPGKLVDTLAVLGTLFGLATSLGLGAIQINAGLNSLFQWPQSVPVQILVIVLVTLAAIASLLAGLDKGIRRLSEANMVLAALLLLFVLLAGPTAALLRGLPDLLGNYLQSALGQGLRTHPFRSIEWQQNWTLFYWAWWLSWAPFVSTFIARISEGRSLREFAIGVLLAPTLIALLWFGIFGGAALREILAGGVQLADVVARDSSMAIFAFIQAFPFQQFTSLITITLVVVFFITSSDSGSLVVDMLASGGNPEPPAWQRVFWASLEGLLAAMLLWIGGLGALQAGAVSMGLPFCVLLLCVMYCLWRALERDTAPSRSPV